MSTSIREYLDATKDEALDSQDLVNLAQLEQTGPGKAIMKLVRMKRNRKRELNESSPTRAAEHLKGDIVYGLGEVSALNWVLGIQAAANVEIQERPGD